jgi:hypothetical protein
MWLFSSRKGRRTAQPVRPSLEMLEDRAVPASLSYSTLLNGTVYASAVDSAGDVYVTGNAGPGLPTTPGAFQTSGSGAFVAKLNPTGTVLYATYLGNAGNNYSFNSGTGIAVDAAGDAYVICINPGVPTTANAIASSYTSSGRDFVAESNPTGSTLLYATYLPGTLNYALTLGYSGAIAVDGSGNIDVAGAAGPGLPVTAGALQSAYLGGSGGNDAFFAKINPALSGSASLLYATYLGGSSGTDQASGIALDGAGNAYVTGFTFSTDFPKTSGAFQRTYGGGGDAFVAKFNPALSGAASLVYSTYLGGSGLDGYQAPTAFAIDAHINGGITVDSAGNAYVTGSTSSSNFPTTPGAFQVHSSFGKSGGWGSPSDAFVTKLNATGTALVYSTYLGGGSKSQSAGTSIALDANGDAYLTGWTTSTSFPTQNPLQATNSGGYNAFVTVLNPSGSGLLFSTYLGGTSTVGGVGDGGGSIGLDSQGNVYVAVTGGPVDKITPVASLPSVHSLTVTSFPSSPTAGVAGTFTVTAKDANGNVLTGYTGTVHFTSSDRHAILPADYTFTAADRGVHTFSATLVTAGSQSIAATDTANGSSGSDIGITVAPAAASTLILAGYPSPTNAGLAASFTVTAFDPYGNKATGYTGTVQFSSSDASATLPAPYTFTASDAGVHTFSATLNTTGTQSLTATDAANISITGSQANITVAPAGLAALGVTGFPSATTAGVSQTFTVTARLNNGSTDTGYLGTVHFTSSDPQAVLPADYTFTAADQGVHTFSVTLKTAGSQSITGTDTVFSSITGSETGIVVSPAGAAQLLLSGPRDVQSGVAFSATLTVEDAYGNVVTGYTGTVHFSTNNTGATLPADYTFTAADAGVHTFTNAFVLVRPRKNPPVFIDIFVTDTQNSNVTGSGLFFVS